MVITPESLHGVFAPEKPPKHFKNNQMGNFTKNACLQILFIGSLVEGIVFIAALIHFAQYFKFSFYPVLPSLGQAKSEIIKILKIGIKNLRKV